jgi:triacylglycerol lipase
MHMSFLVELPENQYIANAFEMFAPRTGFTLENARAMAWIAQLAYETQPEKITRIGGEWGFDDVRCFQQPAKTTLPMSSTHGIVGFRGEATIIAFAGTDPLNLLNWVSDFYLGRPGEDAHQGFVDAAAAVWDEVGEIVGQSIADGRALFIAGHSLGAAIALVTADRARRERKLDHVEIYVFGSPRVWQVDFAKAFIDAFGPTTYRLVYGQDVVATVPPTLLGFQHVGHLLQCARGEKFDAAKLLERDDSDEPAFGVGSLAQLPDKLRLLLVGLSPSMRTDLLGQASQLLLPLIGDHLPDRYYTALAS